MFNPLNKIYMGIISAIVAFISLVTFGIVKKREGAKDAEVKQILEDAEKRAEGKKDVVKEKRDVDGISDSDLVDRLRRRSDDWGGL